MERLTMRSNDTAYWKTGENVGYRPDELCDRREVEALDKLAAYEDTGFSPEELNELRRDLRACRNELCLKCGDYKMAHKGACDGCRWKDMGD